MRTAASLRQQGRRAEAIATVDALVKDRPADADAHTLKARLLLTDPVDADGAWTEANEAVKANADSAPAYYTLGLAAWRGAIRRRGNRVPADAEAESARRRGASADRPPSPGER